MKVTSGPTPRMRAENDPRNILTPHDIYLLEQNDYLCYRFRPFLQQLRNETMTLQNEPIWAEACNRMTTQCIEDKRRDVIPIINNLYTQAWCDMAMRNVRKAMAVTEQLTIQETYTTRYRRDNSTVLHSPPNKRKYSIYQSSSEEEDGEPEEDPTTLNCDQTELMDPNLTESQVTDMMYDIWGNSTQFQFPSQSSQYSIPSSETKTSQESLV